MFQYVPVILLCLYSLTYAVIKIREGKIFHFALGVLATFAGIFVIVSRTLFR